MCALFVHTLCVALSPARSCTACPPSLPLSPPSSTLPTSCQPSCPPAHGAVQDFTDPCDCDVDGVITGITTDKATCKDHDTTFAGPSCYVSMSCPTATASGGTPGTKYRGCDLAVDNYFEYHCEPCQEGFVSGIEDEAQASHCVACPGDTYASNGTCVACPDESHSAPASTGCGAVCFFAHLKDDFGDGWDTNGDQASVSVRKASSDEVVLSGIGETFQSGATKTEGPHCLKGCGCWRARASGGNEHYLGEMSWEFTMNGDIIAAAVAETDSAMFCGGVCETSCPPGSEPNANDDGCGKCPADRYSESTGVELCAQCDANMGTGGAEGSVDCVCKAGFYMGASKCVACEANT